MIFLNILILLIIFLGSSFLSGFVMTRAGYPPPKSLNSREDYLLALMKLIAFTIIVLLSLALLMLLNIDPLHLMNK